MNKSLKEAMELLGVDVFVSYNYRKIETCKCGNISVISKISLRNIKRVNLSLPITSIEDNVLAIDYSIGEYVCSVCETKLARVEEQRTYKFPCELKEYEAFYKFVCELYDLDSNEVLLYVGKQNVAGRYNRTTNSICISSDLVTTQPILLTNIIIHELRHAWQSASGASFDTIKHSMPIEDTDDFKYVNYLDSAQERDAYGFTIKLHSKIVWAYSHNKEASALKSEIKAFGICKDDISDFHPKQYLNIIEQKMINKLF